MTRIVSCPVIAQRLVPLLLPAGARCVLCQVAGVEERRLEDDETSSTSRDASTTDAEIAALTDSTDGNLGAGRVPLL